MRALVASLLLLCCGAAWGQGEVFRVPTRPDVSTAVFWEARPGATATVLLFSGGGGGFGKVKDGRPLGQNFLVRSMGHFIDQGFNVALFGKPSDMTELEYATRVGDAHMADVRGVLDFIRGKSAAPVWIVGTSRGAVSAAAAAIRLQDAGIAGLVLTSSVVDTRKPGALPSQALAAIRVPTLLLHHARDACQICDPAQMPAVLRALSGAPVSKLVMVDGGANPTGDPCEAFHWHGFIGMEKEAVDVIAAFVRKPVP